MQYSLNRDHQHLKGFQDVQEKQQTQCQFTPRSKWKTRQRYLKFQSQNVQIFGHVNHDTSGPNHGPVWKTQSFLQKGICTVILWQDNCGSGNLRKFYWNTVGTNIKLGMFICQPSKRTILISVCGRHQTGRHDRKHGTDLENSDERR